MDAHRIERLVRELIIEYAFPLQLAAVESLEDGWRVTVRTNGGQMIQIAVGRTNQVAHIRERLREWLDAAC